MRLMRLMRLNAAVLGLPSLASVMVPAGYCFNLKARRAEQSVR
jgi:hypothetical protein